MSPAATSCSQEHVAGAVHDAHGAGGGHLEGLVVGAVLLGGLRHQPDVGHRAHRGRVERPVGAAVVDDGLVDPRVGRVGDHREGVGLLAVGAPHVAAGPDHRRHRGVHDHVGGHVQVGDPAVGVDHRQRRARGQLRLERRLDLRAVRERVETRQDPAEPVVGAQAGDGQVVAVGREDLREERRHDVAEDDRVGDLHHRGLEVHREQHVVGLGPRDRVRQERVEVGHLHDGGVDDLAGQHRHRVLEHRHGAVGGLVLDAEGVVGVDHHRPLVGLEVVLRPWSPRWSASRGSRRPSSGGACARSP